MNQEVMSPEQIAEQEATAQRMAERAGENTRTYTLLPTITVYNPSKTQSDSTLEIGDIVKTIKTEAGYETEKYENPFTGIILKVRMFLKLKYKYSEGKPAIITNEFDSYADDQIISVKEKKIEKDAKFEEVFQGNYKEVNDKFSLKDDTTIEKKLDLHHAIYVLRDLETKEVVRIDSKGLSRSNFFDYMNSFSRRGGDFMSTCYTSFGSMVSDKDFNGKPRQAPVAALTFTKGERVADLAKTEAFQIEFERQLLERDKAFGSVKIAPVEDTKQIAPAEELPTINLDDEPAPLPLDEEKDEVKIEDVPF